MYVFVYLWVLLDVSPCSVPPPPLGHFLLNSHDTNESREQFSQYGDITSVILRVKHIGQDIRTWAFVEYGSTEMVEPAIAGSESLELGGVPCTVEARKSTPTPRC